MLSIIKPDDFHCHLRDDSVLSVTVPVTAQKFARAIVMPNLVPPVIHYNDAEKYYQRILSNIPQDNNFKPLMTLYLSSQTSANDIIQAAKSNNIFACKLYPMGATTNSLYGISIDNLKNIYPLLSTMMQYDLPLLIHGESTDPKIDIFKREEEFIKKYLVDILNNFPKLRIVLEHISSKFAVDFVTNHKSKYLAATITPHHLIINRNDLLVGGIKPHYYCLPIVKKFEDQQALIKAAISGNPKFFAGTDSAPHNIQNKESSCGCAGIFNSNVAIEAYTKVFDDNNCLNNLEGFLSKFGAQFYHLPYNQDKITLVKKDYRPQEYFEYSINNQNYKIKSFLSDAILPWQIAS